MYFNFSRYLGGSMLVVLTIMTVMTTRTAVCFILVSTTKVQLQQDVELVLELFHFMPLMSLMSRKRILTFPQS